VLVGSGEPPPNDQEHICYLWKDNLGYLKHIIHVLLLIVQNLADIAVFVQVVKANSFTAAARDLGLSRSVVSKYISRLEQNLGVRLLNRTTRRLRLTEAGVRFYEQSRSALGQLEDAEGEIHAMQAAPKGQLRISAPSSFGVIHLAPLLPELQQTYPDLSIDLSIDDKMVDVVEAGIDVAIRIADLPDSTLIARRITQCRYVVCASPNYLEHYGTPSTPDDLAQHDCLLFKFWGSPVQWQFVDKDDQFADVTVRGDLISNNSLALREILLSGGGITMAPTFLVGEDIQKGRLTALFDDFRFKPLSIYAVYPHRQYLAAKVRAFLEFLSAHIDTEVPYWDTSLIVRSQRPAGIKNEKFRS
jgi:DNA-binding transcriptional LysR family regulator